MRIPSENSEEEPSPPTRSDLSHQLAHGADLRREFLLSESVRSAAALHSCLWGNASMKLEVEQDLPPEVLKLVSAVDLRDVYRTEIVLRLFEEDQIGSAQATHLLGLTRMQFMELLRRRGIPHVSYTSDDLTEDLKDLNSLRPEIEKNVAESRARGLK